MAHDIAPYLISPLGEPCRARHNLIATWCGMGTKQQTGHAHMDADACIARLAGHKPLHIALSPTPFVVPGSQLHFCWASGTSCGLQCTTLQKRIGAVLPGTSFNGRLGGPGEERNRDSRRGVQGKVSGNVQPELHKPLIPEIVVSRDPYGYAAYVHTWPTGRRLSCMSWGRRPALLVSSVDRQGRRSRNVSQVPAGVVPRVVVEVAKQSIRACLLSIGQGGK